MKAYQLRIGIKRYKPATWWRCVVPGGITYSQLSLILTDVMGIDIGEEFIFEFYRRKLRLYEGWESRRDMRRVNYSTGEAAEFYIDELLDQEDWFSFYCGAGRKWKLRVTVEGRMEDGKPWPCITEIRDVEGKARGKDLEETAGRINEELKKKYTVHYVTGRQRPSACKSREEIRREHQAGRPGLAGWAQPENDPQKIKYSAESYLLKAAEVFREKYGDGMTEDLERVLRGETELHFGLALEAAGEEPEDGGQEPSATGRLSLPQLLLLGGREFLRNLARDLEVAQQAGTDREVLAAQVAERLLETQVMEPCFLVLDDDTIRAWEQAAAAGGRYRPSPEELGCLERLSASGYLAVYDNDQVEVPPQAADRYRQICTPAFEARRKQALWLLECLEMHAVIYGVSPVQVVQTLYGKKPGFYLDEADFTRVFQDIPDRSNPCVLLEGRVVAKAAMKDHVWQRLEKLQESWEFSIPEAEEIHMCSRDGYPSGNPWYQKLRQFLQGPLGLGASAAGRCLVELWGMLAWGYGTRELTGWIREKSPKQPEADVWEEWGMLVDQVRVHTRSLRYRGRIIER